jgi:hypothetical protein
VIIIACPVAKQIRRLNMNKISEITFIYDPIADICFLRRGKSIRELLLLKVPASIKAKSTVPDFKLTNWLVIEYLLGEISLK